MTCAPRVHAGAGSAAPSPARGAPHRGRRRRGPLAQTTSFSEGRASRSRSARAPASKRCQPAAPIMAALSVHRPGRGTTQRHTEATGAGRDALAQDRVGGHAAAEDDGPRPRARGQRAASWSRARPRPTPGRPRPAQRRRSPRGRSHPDRGPRPGRPSASATARRAAVLRPLKEKSIGLAQPGAREASVVLRRRVCGAHDGRPARVRQPQQPADLVEGLARGIVHGLAQQAVAQMRAHLDDEGVATADHQGHAAGTPVRAAPPRRDRAARRHRCGPRGG